jgi:membrane protease YdiL (CAAX protease family)
MEGGPEPAARIAQRLAGTLALIGCIVLATLLARRPLARTLGLVRGRVSPWTWPLLAASTLACWLAAALGVHLLARLAGASDESASVSHFFALVHGAPLWMAATMIALAALGAGASEELMARGWMQNQLLERWTPALAVVVSALVFGMVHGEAARVLYAFPMGVWLGYVAYRCGSVIPAMICHATANAAPLVVDRAGVGFDPGTATAASWVAFGVALVACGAAGFVAIRDLERVARAAPGDLDAHPPPV